VWWPASDESTPCISGEPGGWACATTCESKGTSPQEGGIMRLIYAKAG
jgi:hypothetical protein